MMHFLPWRGHGRHNKTNPEMIVYGDAKAINISKVVRLMLQFRERRARTAVNALNDPALQFTLNADFLTVSRCI